MTARQAAPKPLSALLDQHREMEERFALHQDALLMRNASGAARHLERYAALLLPHLEVEEQLLLPLYQARGQPAVGATPAVFQAEHRKIRADLGELERRTAELSGCAAGDACRETLRRFLALIDREYLFKDYLKHHDLRERNALYPELDRITSPEERAGLWEEIERRGNAATASEPRGS